MFKFELPSPSSEEKEPTDFTSYDLCFLSKIGMTSHEHQGLGAAERIVLINNGVNPEEAEGFPPIFNDITIMLYLCYDPKISAALASQYHGPHIEKPYLPQDIVVFQENNVSGKFVKEVQEFAAGLKGSPIGISFDPTRSERIVSLRKIMNERDCTLLTAIMEIEEEIEKE